MGFVCSTSFWVAQHPSFAAEEGRTYFELQGNQWRVLLFFFMRHLTEKRKILAARMLARKIGYLTTQDFPATVFENLPIQDFNAHRILRPKDQLFVVKRGVVEIWHTHHDMLVAELGTGALFGKMSQLGQTMLGTKAIAGTEGVRVAVMNAAAARQSIEASAL